MRGDFLFYEEKIETTIEEKEAKAARRYVVMDVIFGCDCASHSLLDSGPGGPWIPSLFNQLPPEDKTDPPSQMVSQSRRIQPMSI